ncbi:MAG TPA: DnaJ C-terminal domain-containing protein [Steroidobacteraceae bacterium]|nr:DnaJ C-terminal domain-containing protein [Steroidobacteraceae bacterium]
MEFKDYYKIMGVARDASETQIKQAYRKLARKYHPDVSKEKNAEARFKELGEAYEVLKNPEKRAAYDQLGSGHSAGEQFRPPPDWGAGFEFSGGGGDSAAYSEFFEALFGRQGRGRHATRGGFDAAHGEDHHAKVLLDLEASFAGGTRAISLRVPDLDASGRLQLKERTLNVQIPKGILAGQTIRLAGQGARGAGGGAGDLYIEVDFQPHRLYRVDGRDVYLDLPVAPWEAVLGAAVKTPTPSGPIDLKIPPGSKGGTKLRLRGRGIPAQPAGDFFVVLQIALPPANDEKSGAAYRAMAAALPFDPRAGFGV